MRHRLHRRRTGVKQAITSRIERLVRLEAGAANAIGRMVTAEEIAYVTAFLCSPLAVGITGEMIRVTGGTRRNVYC